MNPQMARDHRAAFARAMLERSADPVAVIPAGGEVRRNGDVHFRFRPESDAWYLTAFPEPDAVAVLRPASETPFTLFVRPRDPEQETWHGRRAGTAGAIERYGADAAHEVAAFGGDLRALLSGADTLYYRTGADLDRDRTVLGAANALRAATRDGTTGPAAIVDPGEILNEMRLHKSADELAVLRRAAAITAEAHAAARDALRPGVAEYEVEAAVDGTFRRRGGWGPGYPTICASGDNANILHYTVNDAVVGEHDALLLDAGCELDGYTADVTRCYPASGRFTDAQRELYEVVLRAQEAAVARVAPDVPFVSVHEVAVRHLVEGMLELELLTGTVDEALEGKTYTRYYMHRTSHWLGIDVHDVGSYFADGDSRPLEPGMVLTVEPGLYVPADAELAPERLRGIGIRIEDDVLVTDDGNEVLTHETPKAVADVERDA